MSYAEVALAEEKKSLFQQGEMLSMNSPFSVSPAFKLLCASGHNLAWVWLGQECLN